MSDNLLSNINNPYRFTSYDRPNFLKLAPKITRFIIDIVAVKKKALMHHEAAGV
jgi:hypothetical protein